MAKAKETPVSEITGPQIGSIVELALRDIWQDEKENLRRFHPDAKKIADLAENIRHYGGLINPITVRALTSEESENSPDGTTHKLIAGHQRYKALMKLGEEGGMLLPVAAQVVSMGGEEDRIKNGQILNLDENIRRHELTSIDLAFALAEIQSGTDMTIAELGKKFGKTQGWASQVLSLLKLRPEVQKLIHEGVIPMRLARLLPSLEEAEQDLRIKAVQEGASGSEQEELARGKRGKKKSGRKAKEKEAGGGISAKKGILLLAEVVEEIKALEKPTKADTAVLEVFNRVRKFLEGKLGIKALKNQLTELV